MDLTGRVAVLAQRQVRLEREVEKAEESLKVAKAALAQVAERDLPEAMEALELVELLMADGSRVTLSDDVAVGITKEREPQAFAWLRAHGHGRLLKRLVAVSFGRDEDATAERTFAQLAGQFGPRASQKVTVHFQTLKAFVKEQLRDGQPLPMELFGVVPLKRTKVTLSLTA